MIACSVFNAKRLLLIVGLFVSALASAQPDTLWTQIISGDGDYYAARVATGDQGDIVVYGTTTDTPGGDADFFVNTYSFGGSLVSAFHYGDSLPQFLSAANGGLLCGYELQYNPTRTSALTLATMQGEIAWRASISGGDTISASAQACGVNNGFPWFAGTVTSPNSSQPFLDVRMHGGEPLSAHTYTAAGQPSLADGIVLSDNNYLFAGTSRLDSVAQTRPWLLHANNAGGQEWSRIYPGDGDSYLLCVAEVPAGGYIAAGLSFANDAEGDFYALRLAANGDVLWERWYGESDGEDHGHRIVVTPDGGFLFGGHTHDHHGGGEQYSIYKLAANGDVEWQIVSGGPESEVVSDLVLTDDGGFAFCGYAVGDDGRVSTYVARYGPLSAAGEALVSPRTFALHPAYPNPFNPETRISYELRSESRVRLAIYDVRGALVRLLVDESQSSGAHTVRFDGGLLPGGIYFARLAANGQTSVQKLMLLK